MGGLLHPRPKGQGFQKKKVKMISAIAMMVAIIGGFFFISPFNAVILAWGIGALLMGAGVVCGISLKKEELG
ncbi:hypothetical protein [Thermococcus stetteri]|uniref:hypothetical protein n=1 Tax=Thermococcus stetteri TaxID=49900 RepID=UPI001AE20945|nr:hypothetical protein [Thermococcus stetteri]MBP1912423.1 hypothetical protein [Thermococcus stetteri]